MNGNYTKVVYINYEKNFSNDQNCLTAKMRVFPPIKNTLADAGSHLMGDSIVQWRISQMLTRQFVPPLKGLSLLIFARIKIQVHFEFLGSV